jgi:putative oxidoreductase
MPSKREALLLDLGLLLLRLSFGLTMFFAYGLTKIADHAWWSNNFHDPLGVGVEASLWLVIFAEAGCALAIVAGFATRLATLPLAFAMLVAATLVHGGGEFFSRDQERSLLYLFPFLALALTGPGRFSADRWLMERWKARRAAQSSKER